MAKPVPGAQDMQIAISNCASAVQRAIAGKSNDLDMLVQIATALQQATNGMKQALQAIYDEVV